MSQSGSTANAVGNNIYPDLTLTRYPEAFDERSGSKKNPNLSRWTNLRDYNMAEHVNSLQDTVMALQRTLGEMAQMPSKPVNSNGQPITNSGQLVNLSKTSTVKKRIDDLETKDWFSIFDKRYGGKTWTFNESRTVNPTIQQHRHLGSASGIAGMPEKIVLTQEVQGLLPKTNVNLTKNAPGITGADIWVNRSSPQKVSTALSDKVSETTGGVIRQNATLNNQGKTQTRWTREFDMRDASLSGNTIIQDSNTLLNQAVRSSLQSASTLLDKRLDGMYYGRYVAIVRLATGGTRNVNVAEIAALNSSGGVIGRQYIRGTDFGGQNRYKNFYLIFENSGPTRIRVRKLGTTTDSSLRFDYAIIEPVHPAVFDK